MIELSANVTAGWELKTLGDIVSILTDYTANGSFESLKINVTYYSEPNFAVLVRTTDLEKKPFKPERFTDENGYKFLKKTALYGGEIVLANVGSVGKVYIVPEYNSPMTLAPNTYLVKFSDEVDQKFVYQFLISEFYISGLYRTINSTTLAAINKDNFRSIPIFLPNNKKEQTSIRKVLETADQAIEKTEALITKYQQIKAGLMHDLFTRGLTTDGKLRPPREQAQELYQETPIGWIPKEWEVWEFEKVAQILDPQPDHRTPPEQLDGIPYIGIGDFDLNGELDTNGCRKIIPGAYEKQRLRFTTESGDIIFGKIGTIGHPKILPSGRYALSANVLLIKSTIGSSYMFHILNAAFFGKQISDITNTTSQPALGIEKVRGLLIPLPSDDKEKDKISALLDSCYLNISNNFVYLQKLKKQKLGLMHDLLTGKVTVTIDQAETAHV